MLNSMREPSKQLVDTLHKNRAVRCFQTCRHQFVHALTRNDNWCCELDTTTSRAPNGPETADVPGAHALQLEWRRLKEGKESKDGKDFFCKKVRNGEQIFFIEKKRFQKKINNGKKNQENGVATVRGLPSPNTRTGK